MLREVTVSFMLNQIPEVAIQVFKHRHRSVGLIDWLSDEFNPLGQHLIVITPKVIRA